MTPDGSGKDGEATRALGSRVIGRYRLIERVGEARHAGAPVAWQAYDEVLRRPVAMLTFGPRTAGAGEVLAAAIAASRIGDVRFAHVFDAADGPEGAYVVTEWPAGKCLADLLADGPLEAARAVLIVAEVARALSVAHAAGVAHLCLSPRAVRWTPDGGVKITGLAVDAALANAHSGDGALADTRALAALLYASLSGQTPGQTMPPVPARRRESYRAGIPRRIDSVIRRTLLPGSRRGGPPISHPAGLAAALADPAIRAAFLTRSGTARHGAPRSPRLPRLRTVFLSGGALTLAAAAGLGGFVSGRTPTSGQGDITAPGTALSSRRATAPAMPAPPPAGLLTPRAMRSFGPSGPVGAYGSPSRGWRTHWYTTARFGNLQAGTGLLLDMGRPVQITGVRITLGALPGADLQVRIAATTTSERAFRTVARARNAGGPTRLATISPVRGRYVLIWFTRLPPAGNGDGTYQASIHALTFYGLPA